MKTTATAPSILRIAYTPDSDDVYNFYAWEHGRVGLDTPGCGVEFHRDHIAELNHAADNEAFDVVAVSSIAYPRLADRYWILSTGNSIGRNFGPMLVSKRYRTKADLRGKRVGVAGTRTTGGVMARMFCPGAEFVEIAYDRIADAVVQGECDAGVMIHEEILFFPGKGLHGVCDLGKAWCQDTGLPLPVGLNLVRKKMGMELARNVAGACHRSLRWAIDHTDEVAAFARKFGRGMAREHIQMFSNEDTLRLPEDACRSLGVLFHRLAGIGLAPSIESFQVVAEDGPTRWEVPTQ